MIEVEKLLFQFTCFFGKWKFFFEIADCVLTSCFYSIIVLSAQYSGTVIQYLTDLDYIFVHGT